MALKWKNILAHPTMYHYARHFATGGLPFRKWTELYGLTDTNERVADLGCGPCDILRYVSPQCRLAFYLGIDISEEYLDAARRRAAVAKLDAKFPRGGPYEFTHGCPRAATLVRTVGQTPYHTGAAAGVIHHIDDASALTTLNLMHALPTVRSMVTQDIIRIPGHSINNRYCDMDRGEHIRDEAGYDVTGLPVSRRVPSQCHSHASAMISPTLLRGTQSSRGYRKSKRPFSSTRKVGIGHQGFSGLRTEIEFMEFSLFLGHDW
ncbi:MAG: methyltransferase domain-containing protein [Gammaproteobacteria bacterium]